MGIIASNGYLAVFSAGTLLGVSTAYFMLKTGNNPRKIYEKGQEEKYEFEDPSDEYRLIMAIRSDLKMKKGKVAAQCGHAAVAAYAKALNERPNLLRNWMRYGGTKITVSIESEADLLELDKKAKEINVLSSIIRDAGQTQVAPGSRTVIAIGPAPKSVLQKLTGHLKLY